MSLIYNHETKQAALSRHLLGGESIRHIAEDTGIAKSTLYFWLKKQTSNSSVSPRETYLLQKRVQKLTEITEILKVVDCTAQAPLREKLNALEKLHGKYSVHALCEALNVPRGTFYNHIFRSKKDNAWFVKRRIEMREQIQKIFDEYHQIFGARKIASILREHGFRVSEKYVSELMHELGLHSIRSGAKSLYERQQRKFVNRTNQHFTAAKPNELWLSDVTYFRFGETSFYICAILDVYSRKIVAYRISHANSTQLTKSTLKDAYENRHPEKGLILHTDRGSNFVSKVFCTAAREMNIIQSYSRTQTPHDNAMIESFFAILKNEELYRTNYRSVKEFKKSVGKYIEMYNTTHGPIQHLAIKRQMRRKPHTFYLFNIKHPGSKIVR